MSGAGQIPAGGFPDDLIACALGDSGEPWQQLCARGVLGDPLDALVRLQAFDIPESGFWRAVLSWMAGDEDQACRGLEQQASPAAEALLARIKQPRIKVLTQIPFTGAGSFRLLEGIAADTKFEIRNIGRGTDDLPLRPYERLLDRFFDVHDFAFYVCAMIEWQHPPLDLPFLPIPTIGYSSDFDAQFMSLAPWLKAFDHVFVCDQEVECRDVRAIKGRSVHAFPLVFCVPTEVPALKSGRRDIDVFFSGTLFSSYQPDKAEIVHQLLRIPDLRVVQIDGHISHDDYHVLLSRSKITQNFCRHPGAMLTRALESLSLGSIALVQEESVHRIWGGPESGIFTFRPGSVAESVTAILADYDRHGPACEAQAHRIRETFSARAVASKFFRYATVVAATSGRSRDVELSRALTQRRHVFLIGPRPSVADAARDCEDHLAFRHHDLPPSERLNLRARERLLLYCQALHERRQTRSGPLGLDPALDDLREAVACDARALAVRFNLARVLMHLGNEVQANEAESLAIETLAVAMESWRIGPNDDVYPWDFFGTWFNSRVYLDTAVQAMAGRAGSSERLVQLIYASLHHYLAVRRRSVEHARNAYQLDPSFPYYALNYASLLVRGGRPDDAREAAEVLHQIASSSEIGGCARRELQALCERFPGVSTDSDSLCAVYERADCSVLLLNHNLGSLRSDYLSRTIRLGPRTLSRRTEAESPEVPAPRLSIVICGTAGAGCAPVLRALNEQTADRSAYEVIYVDCYEAAPDIASLAHVALSCHQEGFVEHRLHALAQAIERARAEVVIALEVGSAIPSTFVDGMLSSYYVCDDPDARPARHVIVGGWLDNTPSIRYVGFPLAQALTAGGFDVHPLFTGERGTPLELAWRLQQFGLPVMVEADGRRVYRTLPPWWHLPPFSRQRTLLSVCHLLWPKLLDANRVDALLPWRQVHAADPADDLARVEATRFGFNIFRYRAQYIAVRQSLGTIDFRDGLATLFRRFGPEHVVLGDDLESVRSGAAALADGQSSWPAARTERSAPTPAPATVQLVETLHGFNIVIARGKWVGIRHTVGTIEFGTIKNVDDLVVTFGPHNIVLGKTQDKVRKRIEKLAARAERV